MRFLPLSRRQIPLPHAVLLLALLPLAGCGGREAGKPAAEKPAATGSGPSAVAGIDLDSALDLDGNRVRVYSPAGWRRASRSPEYLVRYQSTPQLAYPSVVVLAADPPEGCEEVTKASQRGFVEGVAARLAESFGGEGQPPLIRKPAAVTVGPHPGVAWAAPGEAKLDGPPKKIERDCTAVVVDGRMYTVEAWAPRGKLDDKARAAARAVAAALAVPPLEPVEPLEPDSEPAAAEPEPAAESAAAQ
jgi:hypothetical protein